VDGDAYLRRLTPALEARLARNPSLNIDTFIIPSPYVQDRDLEKDYGHSYVWDEEGELLGYVLVYATPDRSRFHVYKLVTSPFGRGKGIGSAFLFRLGKELPADATVYLYVWERQTETLLFFVNKGFARQGRIVYRNLVFDHLAARVGDLTPAAEEAAPERSGTEELGRTRHDARKTLRLLSDMVDNLSLDNWDRVIEDVNRETRALINLFNAYRDRVDYLHSVDLKELIFERIIPFVEHSRVPCEIRLDLAPRTPAVYAHYLEVGRALVNLVSNSLDAIEEAGRPGVIRLSLREQENGVTLVVEDNGMGMEPERTAIGPDGLPAFVGRSTKAHRVGEGQGTRQIFATFGQDRIRVESEKGRFTRWTMALPRRPSREDTVLRSLEERYRGFQELSEFPDLAVERNRSRIASFIWQTTSLEVLCWDLILPFSRYSNIRDVYRGILAYWHAAASSDESASFEALRADLGNCRVEPPEVREWLLESVRMVRRNAEAVARHVDYAEYVGHTFRSYGQSVGTTVIFTMDPGTGRFLAADRKLAEHLDFVPYLGGKRDELLRGELTGDVKQQENALRLGVWSVTGEADARAKLSMVGRGCATLIRAGIPPEKQVVFYNTTYRSGPVELNTYLTMTLAELGTAEGAGLDRYLTAADDETFYSGAAD
jgi:ribosomal protein S18 acetylase RimI-like enzyme/anti-sigma regulatory factor (Ser/Thr protein kinase)